MHRVNGSPELLTSTSQWDDTRVRFDCFASTQAQANALRDAVVSASGFGGPTAPVFTNGVATPFIRADKMEARERGRASGSKLLFKAVALFQTRVRLN